MRLEDVRVGMRVAVRSEAGQTGTVVEVAEEATEFAVVVEFDDGTLWTYSPSEIEPAEVQA